MFPGNWIGRKPENGGNGCEATEISPTLTKMDVPGVADSIDMEYNAKTLDHPLVTLLKGSPTGGGSPLPAIHQNSVVRRITPREAGRLQGFPDDYTAIRGDKTPDGPQYAAYGNSMAVPVMEWIGRRIQLVDNLLNTQHT
jgi:DNA (cytosine-5)-methyltransferase 1